jgi:hypothetical protein
MSTSARSAKAGRSNSAATDSPLDPASIVPSSASTPHDFLVTLSEGDWLKLSGAVSLGRALVEYEIRECQEVFADNPNEESLHYWRQCLSDAQEAQAVLTQIRATAQRHLT